MNKILVLHIKLTKKGLSPRIVTLQLKNVQKHGIVDGECSGKNHVKDFRDVF